MDYSTSLSLLAAYSVVIIAAALLGGWLPSVFRMTHTRTQTMMSFVSGLLLGVALYHLLPAGGARIGGEKAMETAAWWMAWGILMMVVLLRLFQFRRHGADEPVAPYDPVAVRSLNWVGIALGMGLHTITEGLALGAAVLVGAAGKAEAAGFSTFLAILLHKPLDALSITSTMRAAGVRQRLCLLANMVFALLCPAAAFLAFGGGVLLGQQQEYVLGCGLAFLAGAFLCIALSDLLPEAHFHRHDRIKLTLAFCAGLGLVYLLHQPGH